MQDTWAWIYILYNYELYKLTIKIYVQKYVLDYFLEQKDVFSLLVHNDLILIFIIIITIYTIKFEF